MQCTQVFWRWMFEPKQLNDYDIVPKGNWSFSQNYAPEEYFEFIYIFIMIVLYSQITKNFFKNVGWPLQLWLCKWRYSCTLFSAWPNLQVVEIMNHCLFKVQIHPCSNKVKKKSSIDGIVQTVKHTNTKW